MSKHKDEPEFRIIESEYQQELYRNGVKIAESRYLTVGEVLTALGLDWDYRWKDED